MGDSVSTHPLLAGGPAPRPRARRGFAAAGRPAARRLARALARRGAHPHRDPQPRRRVLPPAVGEARRRRGGGACRGARHRRRPAARCRTPSPVPGGMLIGTVDEVGPESSLGLAVGDHVATLVSLSLTPLVITDDLAGWDGRSERVPAAGPRDPLRPVDRGPAARRPEPRPGPHGHGRVRRAGTRGPCGGGVCRARRQPHGVCPRRGRQVRLAVARGRGGCRSRATDRRGALRA